MYLTYAQSIAHTITSYWNYWFRPLCYASYVGNLYQLQFLLEQQNANINERSYLNESIIEIASRNGHEEVISYLLTSYGTSFSGDDLSKAFIETFKSSFSTPRSFQLVKDYCEKNNISNFLVLEELYVDKLLSTALLHSKDPQIVHWLLHDCCADPTSCFGETLIFASKTTEFTKDEEDILAMLVAYGLPLQQTPPSSKGFVEIIKTGHYPVKKQSYGSLPAVLVSQNFPIMTKLNEERAKFLQFAEKSEQILKAASTGDVTKILELAKDPELQERINHCRTQARNTPLALAAFEGHLEVVRALLDNFHCDINCTNDHNATPLIMATHGKHPEIVEELVKRGANKGVKTGKMTIRKGRTALDIAKDKELLSPKYRRIIKVLQAGELPSEAHTAEDVQVEMSQIDEGNEPQSMETQTNQSYEEQPIQTVEV